MLSLAYQLLSTKGGKNEDIKDKSGWNEFTSDSILMVESSCSRDYRYFLFQI